MKTSSIRRTLLLLAASLVVVSVSSCRTFRGFGRDVQHVGSHIERAAN